MEYVKVNKDRSEGFKVTEVWAFISEDSDGTEGVIGMKTNEGWMPFVCADRVRMEALRPHAKRIKHESGKEIRIKHFRLDDAEEQL